MRTKISREELINKSLNKKPAVNKIIAETKEDVNDAVEELDLESMSTADKLSLVKEIIDSCEDDDCEDFCEKVTKYCADVMEEMGDDEGDDEEEETEEDDSDEE